MHPALQAIENHIRGTDYEGKVWLVGGAVRDELLGRPLKTDFDLVTEFRPEPLVEDLAGAYGSAPPETYPRFGTAMLRLKDATLEFAAARAESYDECSRKPMVEPATLEEDALRRDFTINTLLRNISTGELRDILGVGLSDLEAKQLRTPREPRATFFDDPLRILRAVRFKWTLGFEYVPELCEALKAEAPRLSIISQERIRDELIRILDLVDADQAFDEMMNLGILEQFAPELVAMSGVEQGRFHDADVWRHSLRVLRNVGPGNLTLSLAALLHDVGKPSTKTIDESGDIRFFGHEAVGADIARDMLLRLRFGTALAERVWKLVKNHMRLGSSPTFTESAARRLIRDMGDDLEDLLRLIEADAGALKKGVRIFDLAEIKRQIEKVRSETPAGALESPLSGDEIMQILGIASGPEVGMAKKWLLDRILEGDLLPGNREGAVTMLRNWWQARRKGSV